MYSIHNEGKSVVAERFVKTLKTKIYKYMTSISKNVYVDKLDEIVNEYNNTYHRTIMMKPVNAKDNACVMRCAIWYQTVKSGYQAFEWLAKTLFYLVRMCLNGLVRKALPSIRLHGIQTLT